MLHVQRGHMPAEEYVLDVNKYHCRSTAHCGAIAALFS